MKRVDSKVAKSIHDKDLETDKKALAVIKDLELENGQSVSEEDLLAVIKAYYGENYPEVMSDLINSRYMNTLYVVNLKAKTE